MREPFCYCVSSRWDWEAAAVVRSMVSGRKEQGIIGIVNLPEDVFELKWTGSRRDAMENTGLHLICIF